MNKEPDKHKMDPYLAMGKDRWTDKQNRDPNISLGKDR